MIYYCRSFAQTSSRLLNALPQVFSRPADSEKDDLIRLSFNAIEVVYSVRTTILAAFVDIIPFSSGNFVLIVL